jgi:TonB family protein
MNGETSGAIQLEVTVDCNGLVSAARVTEGIGHGCDELAATALRNARFKAARTNTGKNARVKINYVYDYPAPAAPPVDPPPETTETETPAGSEPTAAPPVEADAPTD